MSNLSKLLKFENFNTEHLSVAVDMNSGGEMSKFVIPLFDNFVKRNFNISLFLPVFKGDVFYLSSALSFFWKLRNVKDELYLLRNGMIETKFTYSDGIFLAKETGEMLIPTKNNSDDEIKITDDNNLTYYFQMPSLSSKGTYNLKRIEYPDGFRLLFDDKVNFVLKTENMNEKTSPIWMAEFDLKRTDDIQEFKIYTKLGEEERIYCKGSITKKENTATYYTIDIININENGKEYKRKYEYQVKDDYNSLSYLEDDIRTESINFYEEGDNLEIRLYGQVKEHRYNLERGLDYVKLEDKTYTDYPLSKIYTLRKSSDISYYYITSSYSNNGYGSCFNLDEKGRIIETADNIPYACSKDNLLKNIPTNINVVEDKNFAFNNLVNSSSYLLESGKNIVFETSTMVLSQNKYLATLFIKKLEETKEAKIRLQIINGEEKEETYLIDEYIPFSSYVFSCLGYIAKKSNTRINVKIENIGTSKVLLKEVQLLKNYGTIKYEYEEDKVKSISDGEKRIENFYDENGRAIYSYGQQESGITTYKKNNKYNLPEKVEDYLGNIQENEYTHVPKEYQIGTEGNWKVTKSRAKLGKETFEQEREYDDETWNLIKEIDNEGKETKYSYGETEKVEKEESSVEIEKDKEGRVISYKFTYPKVYDAPLINEQRYEKDLLSRTWASYREEEKDKLIYEYDEYQRLKRIKTEKGILVNEFTYDENDQVLSTKTGTSETSFSYDEYGRIKNIKNEGNYEYEYNYSSIYDLTSVEDKVSKIKIEYEKDNENLLSSISLKEGTEEKSKINYKTDYLTGKIISNVENKNYLDIESEEGISIYEEQIKTIEQDFIKQGYYSSSYGYLANLRNEEEIKIPKGIYVATKNINTHCIKGTKLSYEIEEKEKIIIAVVFYGTNILVELEGISIKGSNGYLSVITNGKTVTSRRIGKADKFNYLTLTLGTKSSFIFNGQYKEIDYIKTKLKNLVITGTYSLLALKQEEATKNDLEDIARHLSYLIEDKIINKDGIGISAIYSKEIYDIKKNSSAKYYIPLNGSLVQNIINASNITKIEEPYIFEEKETNFKLSQNRIFKYNENKKMYDARSKNTLAYRINNSKSKTIKLNIYPFSVEEEQEEVIFSIKKSKTEKYLTLAKKKNQIYLYAEKNKENKLISTATIKAEEITTIYVTYVEAITSHGSSLDEELDVRAFIKIGENVVNKAFLSLTPTNRTTKLLYVGKDEEETFNGLLSDIEIIDEQIDLTKDVESKKYNITSYNDIASRPVVEEIIDNNKKVILKKKYYYKENTNKIIKEEIENNEEKQSNEIEYDNSNRIIKLGERKFSYDYYGRLISDSLKDESYSYDNFGNILTKRRGDKFYQYLYEDNLLKEIRNNEESIKLEYGTSLYPKKIIRTKDNKEENIELNYIGRRLEKVEVGGKEYKYTYDDQGQRIKKEGNGKEEYYFYEEERIKEVITKEYRLIYRYVGEEVKGVTYKNENKEISYFYEKNILGEIIGIVDEEGKRVVEYRSSSYGEVENIHDNSKIEISAKDHLRYKGYIYDEETRLYYLKTRYYDPEIGRFISPDSIDYQSPESINGLNLYAYCGNDPVNYSDGFGHMPEWVQDTLKVLGAVAIVVGVTALTVVTAGVAAYALGASAAMIGTITTGAAVGGLVAGGLEIGAQIYENGIDGMNLGAIAIESFAGSAYGAISGVASSTTSAALRLGMRGARVALGGLSAALHGINNGDSFSTIMLNVGVSIGIGFLIQGAFVGLDAYTGKLSSTILQNYALDGALNFGGNQLLLMSGILLGKNVWRNRGLFV